MSEPTVKTILEAIEMLDNQPCKSTQIYPPLTKEEEEALLKLGGKSKSN
mgnify:FL=1